MASTYMTHYRKKCRDERDSKINTARREYENSEYNLTRGIKQHRQWGEFTKPGAVTSAVISIILMFIVKDTSILLGGLIAFPILTTILVTVKNNEIDRNNDAIRASCASLLKTFNQKTATYEKECDQKIAKEEQRYRATAAKARSRYGGSTVTGPIVKHLTDRFETEIRAACRDIYIATITAQLKYTVEADRIIVLKKLPHSGSFQKAEELDFYKGIGGQRYHNLPDMFDQIGFAQALAKQIEFEIRSKFPKDPVAPSPGQTPKVQIEYDDSTMTLIYQVGNPNYRTAVSLGTGVRK